MDWTPDARTMSTLMGLWAVLGLGAYVYTAVCLMVIARKSGTPNGWLAWIPIANLVLMCHIARQSAGLIVLALIPCTMPVFFFIVWAGIAKARGKPGWTVLLFLVPVVGFLLPIYYAAGPATNGPAAPAPAAGPRVCPKCGAALDADDTFCGECGAPVPAAPPPVRGAATPARPAPAKRRGISPGCLVGLVILLLIAGGVAWFFFGPTRAYREPERAQPALPPRMAGTLTEFPVDTDQQQPARPTAFVTQTFTGGKKGGSTEIAVPQDRFPPGISRSDIPNRASAISSVVYRTAPQAPPVNVHVLSVGYARGGNPADDFTRDVVRSTGGQPQGIQLTSPGGRQYTGQKIVTVQIRVYILYNPNAGTLIIVYSPQPAGFPVAERLVAHVGNGRGVMDYPGLRNSFGALPAQPPAGLEARNVLTYTAHEMTAGINQVESEFGGEGGEQVRQVLTRVRSFVPERLTLALYADRGDEEWVVALGDFGAVRRALRIWYLVRFTAGLGMEPVSVAGGTGLYCARIEDVRFIVFRRGPFVSLVVGPRSADADQLVRIANTCQL
ncbi:MAG: zinc-ribbon domain-containing protein [Kiritimatiellae bacterium]|nr:zinc-ribbon domain-containing protein [Kiritimatiellia bacterium]